MTEQEILDKFKKIRVAYVGSEYVPHKPAPHKPILILLILETVYLGKDNNFLYANLDAPLRKFLEKFGSNNASNTRNEPFWRLKNDGVFEIDAPEYLLNRAETPSPNELISTQVSGKLPSEIDHVIRFTPGLALKIAKQVIEQFIAVDKREVIFALVAPQLKLSSRKYFWVNQNQTYKYEVPGNYLWSPKKKSSGNRNPYYDFMTQVEPGDVVFSYCDTFIKAIGVATKKAESCIKPDFGNSGLTNWIDDDGWFVDVAFQELNGLSFKPSANMGLITPTLPEMDSPIRSDGVENQIYLTIIPEQMAHVLLSLIGNLAQPIIQSLAEEIPLQEEVMNDMDEEILIGRNDIGKTQKLQLVNSRRGQGIFKANVRLNESACRVTGITNPRHLIASHIKPWSKSDDKEKLHGCNGLLLSPHIDHLFDKGFISFGNVGNLIISKHLGPEVLNRWKINIDVNVGRFKAVQEKFLEYHRDVVLL